VPKTSFDVLAKAAITLLAITLWLSPVDFAAAHHVLGRPAYSLNEDSNTPPSMQVETRIGEFFVTTMVFPAFPRPGTPGRINLYASRIDDGTPFAGKVTSTVRDDSWLSWLGADGNEETLGVQPPDENVFRQGFLFHEAGDYIITAEFEAGGEPYVIDFPLRIGKPTPVGPIGVTVGLLVIVLVSVSVIQRRRAMTGKIRSAHEAQDKVARRR
jgi:hypothetical protein